MKMHIARHKKTSPGFFHWKEHTGFSGSIQLAFSSWLDIGLSFEALRRVNMAKKRKQESECDDYKALRSLIHEAYKHVLSTTALMNHEWDGILSPDRWSWLLCTLICPFQYWHLSREKWSDSCSGESMLRSMKINADPCWRILRFIYVFVCSSNDGDFHTFTWLRAHLLSNLS